jgi:hypothetical protein
VKRKIPSPRRESILITPIVQHVTTTTTTTTNTREATQRYVCAYVRTYVRTYIHTYIHTYTHLINYIYMCVCMYVCVCNKERIFQNQNKRYFSLLHSTTGTGKSVSTVTRLRAGQRGFESWQGQGRDFVLFVTASRADLWSTQTPIQWMPGNFSPACS